MSLNAAAGCFMFLDGFSLPFNCLLKLLARDSITFSFFTQGLHTNISLSPKIYSIYTNISLFIFQMSFYTNFGGGVIFV